MSDRRRDAFHARLDPGVPRRDTDDAVFRQGHLDAGRAFLQKPFTPDVLARKVREALKDR